MFSFNLFADSLRPFNTTYRCYSVSMLPGNERRDVERGGKIIMPPSALDHLTRLNIVYPMLFKLTNQAKNRITHCGVLEFVADEGKVYLPYWMMRNLLLDEGSIIKIESTSLPVATYSKFQPQSVDFLDITNPKAVLENALRNFACLSTDDVIAITYNDRVYEVCVLETKPGPAVTIIECDMNVEFAPPVGYQEPNERLKESYHDFQNVHSGDSGEDDVDDDLDDFEAFSGEGQRVDGKKHVKVVKQTKTYKRGIPDYGYEIGTIKFLRVNKNRKDVNDGNNNNDGTNSNNNGNGKTAKPFQAFHGTGQQLITKK